MPALGLLLLCALWIASSSAAGIENAATRIIRAIQWQGLDTLPQETARFYLGIEVGDPLSPEELNRAIYRLWQSRLFDDLEVHTEETYGGIELRISVQPRPLLSSVEFEGLDPISRVAIEKRIAREGLAINPSGTIARGDLERLRHILQAMLRQQGVRSPSVGYRLEPSGPSQVRAIFSASERQRIRIEEIVFRGNTAFGGRRLRREMKRSKQSALVSRLLKRDVHDPADLIEDLEAIRALYREHGYKDVLVGDPKLDIRRVDAPAGRSDGRRYATVTIPVDEGERWSLRALSVTGNRVFSDERLLQTFEGIRGGWLQDSAVNAWRRSIRDLYFRQGRVETEVSVELRERSGGTVDLIAHIQEGEQFRIGRVEFAGNTRTRDGALRRELSVAEGDILNLGALHADALKLHHKRLFEIDEDPIELRNFDDRARIADVVLRGQERDPFDVRFGGGWSEVVGFSAHLVLESPNFLGRGHRAALRMETGGTREGFELAYSVPWFLGRPHTVGVELFDRRSDYSLSAGQRFIRDEAGGTISWGRALGSSQHLRTSYSLASLDDLQIGRDTDGMPIRRELSETKSSLRTVWDYEGRDDLFDPSSGWRAAASLEAAGGLLGGSRRFWKAQADFSWFRLLSRKPKAVLGLNLEAGWIGAPGDEALSPLETFFLGGTESIRGYATRSISPRDLDGELLREEDGLLVGGTRFFEGSLEIHLPRAGPLEAVLFLDSGNVYSEGQSLDLSRLRMTAGAELRLRLARLGAPLRLIWSTNLDPLPEDRFESLQFSFGTSF